MPVAPRCGPAGAPTAIRPAGCAKLRQREDVLDDRLRGGLKDVRRIALWGHGDGDAAGVPDILATTALVEPNHRARLVVERDPDDIEIAVAVTGHSQGTRHQVGHVD